MSRRRAKGNITNYGATGTSELRAVQRRSEPPSGKQEEAAVARSQREGLTLEAAARRGKEIIERETGFSKRDTGFSERDTVLSKLEQRVRVLEQLLRAHNISVPPPDPASAALVQQPDAAPPREPPLPLNKKNKVFIGVIAALAAFTEAYFRVKALEKLFFRQTPFPVWGSALIAVALAPSDIGLEYIEAAAFYQTYLKNTTSWGETLAGLVSQGTVAALLPAAAELCIFSLALKDDLTWPGAIALSSIAALQYLVIEGESLNRLLKKSVFAQDQQFFKGSSGCFVRYLKFAFANFGNLFAASVYLIPAFTDSHGLFLRWFGNGGKHDHERIPTYLATALLCSAYLGGQLCLMGHELKHLVYNTDKLRTLVREQGQNSMKIPKARLAKLGWGLKLVFVFLLLPAATITSGAVAYFFLTEGLRTIFSVKGRPTWLIPVGAVVALPTALQYLITKGLRAMTLINRDSTAWETYTAEDTTLEGGDRETRVPALSFCRFYLMMLGIGCITSTKMIFELFNPQQDTGELLFSYFISAMVALLLHVAVLDVLPLFCGHKTRPQKETAEKPCLSVRQVRGFCGWRALLLLLTWSVGIGAQLALHPLFRRSTSDAEAAEFRSECGGGFLQAVFAIS